MKSAFAVAFAAVAAALPAPQAGTTTPLRLGGMALRSASPIHFGSINANGGSFYIGRNTSTYCPEDSAASDACATANTNQTIFNYLNGQGTLSLDTIVPGGQQVYVTAGDDTYDAGRLAFTPAHSAATDGPAVYEGFVNVYDARLQFEGNDWLACPVPHEEGAYSVWAASRANLTGIENCLGFTFKLTQYDDSTPAAWQYN